MEPPFGDPVRGVRAYVVTAMVVGCAQIAGCALNPAVNPRAGDEHEVRMGIVEEVRRVPLPAGGGFVGTIGGATVGGIAGGAVGSGRGSQASSVAGAIAGSVAGRALESAATATEGLEIAVRTDGGSVILVLQPDGEIFSPGERVRVLSGAKGARVTH